MGAQGGAGGGNAPGGDEEGKVGEGEPADRKTGRTDEEKVDSVTLVHVGDLQTGGRGGKGGVRRIGSRMGSQERSEG